MPRVLLIDDDDALRGVLRLDLEEKGYEVQEASGSAGGVAWLRREPADVVLLDLFVPGSDGFEALRRIRAASAAPVVVMAGGPGCAAPGLAALMARSLGAAGVLRKPFRPSDALAALEAARRGISGSG